MYLPYVKCVAQEDRLGNLEIWVGINHLRPTDETQIAYIQTSQEREYIYENCFGFTEISRNEIEKGWSTVIELHEDVVVDIFS